MALAEDFAPHDDFGHTNFTDREGAAELKARIEAYWAERGHQVQVMLIDAPFNPAVRAARVDVRSNMVDGMPRAALPSQEQRP